LIENWQCGETCDRYPGLTDVKVAYNKKSHILGYTAYDPTLHAIVVVFRGTMPLSGKNWW